MLNTPKINIVCPIHSFGVPQGSTPKVCCSLGVLNTPEFLQCIFKWHGHYQFHAGGWGTSPNDERSVVSNSTLLDRGCGQVIVNNNYPAASVGPQGERGPPGPAG